MNLAWRVFGGFCLLLMLAGWLMFREYHAQLVPGMRSSVEEALVDSANLLAELVARDLADGELTDGEFADAVSRFIERRFQARIGENRRSHADLIVYVTDDQGIVLFDSRGIWQGADFSRWNDVWLTLRNRYGARTTRDNPKDPLSSVMYVAAPVRHDGQLIGVLSVGKPSHGIQQQMELLLDRVGWRIPFLLLIALILAALLTWGLTRSLQRLTRWASGMRHGDQSPPPSLGEPELRQLAAALDDMRRELDGRAYVEQVLLGLTHEIKSPLAAIQGAVELLREPMPETQRQRFLENLESQSSRLQRLADRLLALVTLERQTVPAMEPVKPGDLLESLQRELGPSLRERELDWQLEYQGDGAIVGNPLLLRQAIGNLLENAIAFSPSKGHLELESRIDAQGWQLLVRDQGPGIPDYAQARLFERFYSLPRPDGSPKSSGLGLSLVRQVAELHGGGVTLENRDDGQMGAQARLSIPLNPA